MQLSDNAVGLVACRCLSCDTDLRTRRAMQQGRPPSRPSLLPKLLALDHNSAASPAQASDAGLNARGLQLLRFSVAHCLPYMLSFTKFERDCSALASQQVMAYKRGTKLNFHEIKTI